jgi:hypothetical protein
MQIVPTGVSCLIQASRKVGISSSDEVIAFFQFTLIFKPHYDPGYYSACNRNE